MSLTSETVVEDQYCICRGSYGNRFMLGCDGCDEWFHGSCININSDQAKNVDQYFCPFCVEKNPSLKTIYKNVPKEKERHRERHKEKMRRKEAKKGKHFLDSDSDDQGPVKKEEPRKKAREQMPEIPKKERTEITPTFKKKQEVKLSFTKKAKDESKHRTLPHKDELMKNRLLKEECKLKSKEDVKVKKEDFMKLKNDDVRLKKDEMKIKKEEFKIKKDEFKIKKEEVKHKIPKEDPIVKIKEEPKEDEPSTSSVKIKKEFSEVVKTKTSREDKIIKSKSSPSPLGSFEDVTRKRRKEECKEEITKMKKPAPLKPIKEDSDDGDFDSFLSTLSKAKPRLPSSSEDEEVDVGMEEVALEPVKKQPKERKEKRIGKGLKKKGRPKKHASGQKNVDGSLNDQDSSEEEEKQCIGPACCNAARPRSRYCSEDCGVKLAIKRIQTFLPERREGMKRGGTARKIDEEAIRNLEKQQENAHQRIEVLQNQRLVIMRLIETAKSTKHEGRGSDEEMSDEDQGENEGIDCVTCGMACSDKTAVRHMERCYSKYESKLGLGSTVKCHVTWESPVCDAYDRQQGTYCKKLKVLCPDHNKEKEDHGGICGCPLDLTDMISENVEVCQRAKRACTRHTSWEKLRLAEIDMERVMMDLKLEDSFDEMRKVKYRMANRTNLLQVLLNGTIYHSTDDRPIVTS